MAVDLLTEAVDGGRGMSMNSTAAAGVRLAVVDRPSSTRTESAATVSSSLENFSRMVCSISDVVEAVECVDAILVIADEACP